MIPQEYTEVFHKRLDEHMARIKDVPDVIFNEHQDIAYMVGNAMMAFGEDPTWLNLALAENGMQALEDAINGPKEEEFSLHDSQGSD